jgi:hypothetical protein
MASLYVLGGTVRGHAEINHDQQQDWALVLVSRPVKKLKLTNVRQAT